nr:hypothetical protein [Micromonospora sp. DSM 115978]
MMREAEDGERPRYVVHLPIDAPTLGAAFDLAVVLADVVAFVPSIDQGETTVSYEGDQMEHHRIICNKKIGRPNVRCRLVFGHVDKCEQSRTGSPTGPETPQ